MNRVKRAAELRLLAKSEAGRAKIQKLYKRALKIKAAPKPTSGKMLEMMIETILDHLYPSPEDLPTDDQPAKTPRKIIRCPNCGRVFVGERKESKDAEAPISEVRCPKCSRFVQVDPN